MTVASQTWRNDDATGEYGETVRSQLVEMQAAIVALQQGGGGGSQPRIRTSISHDTPGLTVPMFAVSSFDELAQTITLAGDHVGSIAVGSSVFVSGSAGDATYTAADVTLSGGDTVVTTVEPVSDPGDDPTLTPSAGDDLGIDVFTPADGDVLFVPISYVSVREEWDGTTPNLYLFPQGRPFVADNYFQQSLELPDVSYGANIVFPYPLTDDASTARFTDPTPLRAIVADNNGLNPGATQGAAVIDLGVERA